MSSQIYPTYKSSMMHHNPSSFLGENKSLSYIFYYLHFSLKKSQIVLKFILRGRKSRRQATIIIAIITSSAVVSDEEESKDIIVLLLRMPV